MFFCVWGWGEGLFVSFCLGIFVYLIGCFLFVLVSFLREREKERGRQTCGQHERIRPWSWVGREVGWSWGRRKHDQNVWKINLKGKNNFDTDLKVWCLRDYHSKGTWARLKCCFHLLTSLQGKTKDFSELGNWRIRKDNLMVVASMILLITGYKWKLISRLIHI